MSIIRKIIIKEWLTFFISATIVLLFILSLGNILTNLLKANSTIHQVVLTLAFEIPTFLVKIFPVSCLIASLFSLNKLKNRNELTAIFAAGFSRIKFIITIASLGIFVGIILFYVNAYLVPYSKHQSYLMANQGNEGSITANAVNGGRVWFKGKNYFINYSSFDISTNTLNKLNLYYYNDDYKLIEQISSDQAIYIKEHQWKLNSFKHNTNLNNLTFPTTQILKNKFIDLDESLQDFKKINADISTLSIWKLYEYVKILKSNSLSYRLFICPPFAIYAIWQF